MDDSQGMVPGTIHLRSCGTILPMKNLMDRPLKLYLDTSVPSHLFARDDPKKRLITERFFKMSGHRDYIFFISGVVIREIEKAPMPKRILLLDSLKGMELLELNEESERLAAAYLSQGALPQSSSEDARHIAVATCHNLDAIVSWNFKHLVNLRRTKRVNLVNEQMGYKHIEIVSPEEAIHE